MELEAVRAVAVRDLGFEVRWQVDDVDCIERALLRTDTAPDTQTLANEGDLAVWSHFDTELAGSHHRAGFLAFLAAFLWFAFVAIDDWSCC